MIRLSSISYANSLRGSSIEILTLQYLENTLPYQVRYVIFFNCTISKINNHIVIFHGVDLNNLHFSSINEEALF